MEDTTTNEVNYDSKIEWPREAPNWGEVGYITYKRTYARRLDDDDPNGETEEWAQTLNRVIDGCQKQLNCNFDTSECQELFNLLYNLKGSVAGRFLWQLNSKTVDRLGLASLQNCAFTKVDHPVNPFTWTFDMLMLGSGVGVNVQHKYVCKLPEIKPVKVTRMDTKDADYIVPDSREGWTKLLGKLLKAHFYSGQGFSYSTICLRSKGAPIKSFGGVASGPEVLCEGIDLINGILNKRANSGDPHMHPIDAVDIIDIIGMIVVSGNVRRSAILCLGDPFDLEYLRAKRWDLGNIPNWRAYSNNSVVCDDTKDLPEEFWEGYKGNGEPYGLINLRLARSCGRLGETEYPDKEVCGFNPCITADAWIQTANGPRQVFELLGKKTKVLVNGKLHNTTDKGFWKTGTKTVYTIETKEGFTLRATGNHQILTQGDKWVETEKLVHGDQIILHEHRGDIKWGGEGSYEDGYLLGQLVGDGSFAKGKAVLSSWGDEAKSCRDYIQTILMKKKHRRDFNGWAYINGRDEYRIKPMSLTLLANYFGITQGSKHQLGPKIEKASSRFYCGFICGLFDADGTVAHNHKKGNSVRLNQSNYEMLQVIQRMLLRLGIYSRIYLRRGKSSALMPDGKGGRKLYDRKANYELIITKDSIGEYCRKIGFKDSNKKQKLADILDNYQRKISKSEFTATVKDIILELEEEDVYDCTVPETSAFDANGLYVHNCAEQSLADGETCCLADIFLPNITSEEELWRITQYLYRINKHSLALPCHHRKTAKIVHKNMRMGIGITGYLQATEDQKSWLPKCYEKLRAFDEEYSAKHGWPISIKLTTTKPSGTLSLLPGVTPGVHPGYAPYFIRRIRFANNSPLVQVCREHGYHVEFQKKFDGTDDHTTMVVSFPCHYPEHTIFADDCTALQQLEYVKRLQSEWSDNSVSVTCYYRKEELPKIREWLDKNYRDNMKTVSFLLHSEHGFAQAPYEKISKEEYEKMKQDTRPIAGSHGLHYNKDDEEFMGDTECAGGMCPIK